jgi:DNA topoisomerase I
MPTIIITEKPDASKRIAESIGGKDVRRNERNGAPWYEFDLKGQKIIVVSAVGHIFALDTVKDGTGWSYPTFNVQWVPSYTRKGSEFSERYFRNIARVAKENDKDGKAEYVIATDYDTEGAVIGYNVLKMIAGREDAARMKFSTLTKDELIESFEKRSKHLDMGQVESGLTRHYLDFFWGINLTRALTLAMKHAADSGFALLSTGRVQGPTMNMLLDREMEVRKFKPRPFWQIEAEVKSKDGEGMLAAYEKSNVWDKAEAERITEGCQKPGTKAVVKSVSEKAYKQLPPVPFNTTDMQAEAYAQFKYSPKQTLSIVESLYQDGAVSYPRSSSQKLPPSIDYKRILTAIGKMKPYEKIAQELLKKEKLVPNEGKMTDPAHPAIYPTFEPPAADRLTLQQKNMYDLIVRRFLSVFGKEAIRASKTVDLDIAGSKFKLSGKTTIDPGWTKYYGKYLTFEEKELPTMDEGDALDVGKVEMLSKQTQPPGRFSQGSILREMEKKNLGTRATRADILQTLYDRKYITGKSIEVTKLGEVVTQVLRDNVPEILSEEMTRKFEKESDLVAAGKMRREDVVEEAKKVLTRTLSDFKKNEENIGKKLLESLVESRSEESDMGVCPVCKKSRLRVIVSKKSGKRFIGCGGYPECSTSFPLPQKGFLTKLDAPCKECGLPTIQIQRRGMRPYRMCINHKCASKADWDKDGEKGGFKEKRRPVMERKAVPAKIQPPRDPVGKESEFSAPLYEIEGKNEENNPKIKLSKKKSTKPTVQEKKEIIERILRRKIMSEKKGNGENQRKNEK